VLVGKGTKQPCDGCSEAITAEQVEYELDLADARTLRFHDKCLAAWHAARAERMANRQLTTPILARVRVLIVDDHEDTRDLLQQAFAFLGAYVTTAVTAEEAVQSFKTADIVVTDFALKGNDGAWLLAQINASPRPIPVVLLSGFVEVQTAGIAEAPFALKLLKPIDPMDLAQKIRAILDVSPPQP